MLVRDKVFVFANYEGFIQNLRQTSVAFVPDSQERADAAVWSAKLRPACDLMNGPIENGRMANDGRVAIVSTQGNLLVLRGPR